MIRAGGVKFLQKWSFSLAALLHLLIFLFFSYMWVHQVIQKKELDDYIPSYAYQEAPQKAAEKNIAYKNKPIKQSSREDVQVSEYGIKKPVYNPREVRFNQVMDVSPRTNSEPVHLIGDTSKTPQPLIIILGKALTAKLLYPKSAIDLNIGGISVIGFVLHPDGEVTDVRLLKSSGAAVLDQTAVHAASRITPVRNVGPYVKEPMPIVFGIVFGTPRA